MNPRPRPQAGLPAGLPTALLALLLAAGPLVPGRVLAHEAVPRHGGRVADLGRYHAELVTAGETVAVFLSDGEQALPGAGFTGTAILVVDGKPVRVPLEPAGDRLAGRAARPLGAAPKGAVQITGPDGGTASGRLP